MLLNAASLSIGEKKITNDENTFCDNETEYIFGQMIIKFEGEDKHFTDSPDGTLNTNIQELDRLNSKYGLTKVEQVFNRCSIPTLSNIYLFTLDTSADIINAAEEYNKDPHVIYAEPNYIYRLRESEDTFGLQTGDGSPVQLNPLNSEFIPNDPKFINQWALHQSTDCDIDAPEAWDIETGNSNVAIAVVDTGVDYNHEDLTENIWINSGEDINGNGIVDLSDFNGIDDDNNGYVDDIRGYDFVDINTTWYEENGYELLPEEDYTDPDNDPMDVHGHGTHCSGIAGATTNNGVGIAGVGWDCSIMSMRAGFKIKICPCGTTGILQSDDIALAMIYATDNGADVISMSWGGKSSSQLILDVVEYAYNQGVVLVSSAGNSNTYQKQYPAFYEEVIAVAATYKNDERKASSNYGFWIDIAAPGDNILSTIPNNEYGKKSGTSMSCPHVAGLAGLLLSKNPSLTPDMIRTIICNTADDIDSDRYIGGGRINAHKALLAEPAIAILKGVPNWENVKEIVNIQGKAGGENFEYFAVEYCRGFNSDYWVELLNSSIPQDDFSIVWDTQGFDDGFYTVRLQTACNDEVYEDIIWILVNKEWNRVHVDDDNTEGPWWGTSVFPYKNTLHAYLGAGEGDEMYFHSGIYRLNYIVKKSIDLIGEDRNTTKLKCAQFVQDYQSWNDAVVISGDWINVSGFTMTADYYGMRLCPGSEHCSIKGNIIRGSDYKTAIAMWTRCKNNTVIGNTIIRDGAWFDSPPGIYISKYYNENHVIYHNNFLTTHPYGNKYIVQDWSYNNNTWDNGYPSGGNYWCHYTGKDLDGDGIGDTPYKIKSWPSSPTYDHYPLMHPIGIESNPPNKPETPSGPVIFSWWSLFGIRPLERYETSGSDPDGDKFRYYIDFGDGSHSWSGFCKSGESYTIWPEWESNWMESGVYDLRVKTIDCYGYESEWSDPFTVWVIIGSDNALAQISRHRNLSPNRQISQLGCELK